MSQQGSKARPRSRAGSPAAPPRSRASAASASRERGAARSAILEAARAEFDERGFEGTDTNRIARRAGYAPQTFYRHFRDKTAVFIESYRRWVEDERRDLEGAHGRGAEEAARVTLRHHARHREFRRSLRRLTVTDAEVRAARASSRKEQLEFVDAEDRRLGRRRAAAMRVALLFCMERLADAAADGELADLGLGEDEQVTMVAEVIRRLAR